MTPPPVTGPPAEGHASETVIRTYFDAMRDVPIFFRAPLLVCLFFVMWGCTTPIFRRCGIDYAPVLAMRRPPSPARGDADAARTVLAALGVLVCVYVSFALYEADVDRDRHRAQVCAAALYAALLALFAAPCDFFRRRARAYVLRTCARLWCPARDARDPAASNDGSNDDGAPSPSPALPALPPKRVAFRDVIAGDVLTSLAKALGDTAAALCVVLAPFFSRRSARSFREGVGRCLTGSYLRPLATSVPFVLRFRQCLVEWQRKRRLRLEQQLQQGGMQRRSSSVAAAAAAAASAAAGVPKPPCCGGRFPTDLANAVKYASSLPVIFLSAYLHVLAVAEADAADAAVHDPVRLAAGEAVPASLLTNAGVVDGEWRWAALFSPGAVRSAWWAAVAFNSLFAFYWDVVHDWGLFSRAADGADGDGQYEQYAGHRPWRHRMGMYPACVYYLAAAADLALRCVWGFRLSVHLHLSFEGYVFLLEILELFRRWMWLFLRVEWECVATGCVYGPGAESSAAGEDIELTLAGGGAKHHRYSPVPTIEEGVEEEDPDDGADADSGGDEGGFLLKEGATGGTGSDSDGGDAV